MAIELTALPETTLPLPVLKIVAGPGPAKLLVAKGIAPLQPAEFLIAIYQIRFDVDGAVKAAAEAAPATLPDAILVTGLGEALPAQVLHFFALRVDRKRVAAVEKILYNRATADETFVVLAERADERELEIVVENERRLLRHPDIVRALYFNRRTRMSSVNRAIELCVRNGVRVEGIPSYDEIARSIGADPTATVPDFADTAFEEALHAADIAQVVIAAERGISPEQATPDEIAAIVAADQAATDGYEDGSEDGFDDGFDDGFEGASGNKKSTTIDFSKLKMHEKIRLATVGNACCRQNLLRDSNRLVALAAINSPGITDGEVAQAAGNRALCEDVIRTICNSRQFVKMYRVKLALVNNPKCPLPNALRLLSFLYPEDLKALSRSKNVPSVLSTAARKLSVTRAGK